MGRQISTEPGVNTLLVSETTAKSSGSVNRKRILFSTDFYIKYTIYK